MKEYNQDNPLPKTSVTFRIFEPNLIPEEITKNLGQEPNHTHRQGDYRRSDPDHKHLPYKHGMWSLDSKVSSDQPLESHLESLLLILEPNSQYIQSLAQHATVDFYCVLYDQNGFNLSPMILKRIADLRAIFGVAVHNPQ